MSTAPVGRSRVAHLTKTLATFLRTLWSRIGQKDAAVGSGKASRCVD